MIGFTTGDDDQDIIEERTTQKNILELFPESNFAVAKTIFKKDLAMQKRIRTIFVCANAASAIISIIAFIAIGHWHPDGYIAFNVLVGSIFVGIVSYVVTTFRI